MPKFVPVVGLPYLNREQFSGVGAALTSIPEKLRNEELKLYTRLNTVSIPASSEALWRSIGTNYQTCCISTTALFVRNNMLYVQVVADDPYTLDHLATELREKAIRDGNQNISRVAINLGISDDYNGPTANVLVFSDTIVEGDDFQSLYFDSTLENPDALVCHWNKRNPNLAKTTTGHFQQISEWAVTNDLAWCPFSVRCTFWETSGPGEKFWELVTHPCALSFDRRWGKASVYRTGKFQTSAFPNGSAMGKEVLKLLRDKLDKKNYAPKYQRTFRKGEIIPTTVDKLLVKVDRSLQRRILREE